jgi:hypothetical protein
VCGSCEIVVCGCERVVCEKVACKRVVCVRVACAKVVREKAGLQSPKRHGGEQGGAFGSRKDVN